LKDLKLGERACFALTNQERRDDGEVIRRQCADRLKEVDNFSRTLAGTQFVYVRLKCTTNFGSRDNAYKTEVPLLVEVGVGENWLEAH
jgi:hypothetical protein